MKKNNIFLALVSILLFSTQSFAQTDTVKKETFSFKLTADGSSGTKQFQIQSPIVHVESKIVQTWVQDYKEIAIWEDRSCQVTEVVSGTSQWKYSRSKRYDSYSKLETASSNKEKANYLADAVQGLGKEYAADLIEKGYFKTAPTSWEAFSNEINRAVDKGIIKKIHQTLILKNNAYENRQRLGYYFDSQPQLVVRYEPCPQIVGYQQIENGGHYENNVVRSEVKAGSVARTVNLIVLSGAIFTPSEVESLTLSFGALNDVQLTGALYNSYSLRVSENLISNENFNGLTIQKINTTLTIDPSSRVRVSADVLGSNLIQSSEIRKSSSDLSVFSTLSSSLKELITLRATKGNVSFVVELYGCELNWFGNCMFSDYKLLERKSVNVDRLDLTTELDTRTSGIKYFVKSYLDFTSNSFYSGSRISEVKSSTVKLN